MQCCQLQGKVCLRYRTWWERRPPVFTERDTKYCACSAVALAGFQPTPAEYTTTARKKRIVNRASVSRTGRGDPYICTTVQADLLLYGSFAHTCATSANIFTVWVGELHAPLYFRIVPIHNFTTLIQTLSVIRKLFFSKMLVAKLRKLINSKHFCELVLT